MSGTVGPSLLLLKALVFAGVVAVVVVLTGGAPLAGAHGPEVPQGGKRIESISDDGDSLTSPLRAPLLREGVIVQAPPPHGNGADENVPSQESEPPAGHVTVGVYDPTGQSPRTIFWLPYPASPPPGFHWEHSGSPAIMLDPTTKQPVPGQFTGAWVLVRDGYTMPKILGVNYT